MTYRYVIVKHPNGGYASVATQEPGETPTATTKDRRFRNPYEALDYASNHYAQIAPKHSTAVRAEIDAQKRYGRAGS